MGSRGIGISIYAIILLSVAILFFPTQHVYGIFILPTELSEKELFELNKKEQLLQAEKLRDYILDFQHTSSPNPYYDEIGDGVAPYDMIFKNYFPEVVRDESETKQEFNKIIQLILAQETLDEIQQGKPISNIYFFEPVSKTSIPAFKIDDQTGFMKRTNEGFQLYKIEQMAISEKICEEIFKENRLFVNDQTNNNKNQEMKFIKVSSVSEIILKNFKDDMITHNLIQREDPEFKNLIAEQISLAEITREHVLKESFTGINPYLNEDIDENVVENIDENIEESSIQTNSGFIIAWSDPTYVTDKPEFNIIDRNAEGFEMVKEMEIEIAQNMLNQMLMFSNSEKTEDDISEDYRTIIMNNEEIKIQEYYDRDDQGFEFFKNKQIDRAEKKLMDILGQKDVHNSVYLEFEK